MTAYSTPSDLITSTMKSPPDVVCVVGSLPGGWVIERDLLGAGRQRLVEILFRRGDLCLRRNRRQRRGADQTGALEEIATIGRCDIEMNLLSVDLRFGMSSLHGGSRPPPDWRWR